MPTTFTTTLPDEDQPVLGNGVEDEVAVDRETVVSNNGSVRIQIRETGQSSWDSEAEGFGEFVGNYDTLQMEFVGRLDGERYEVRARTETAYRTGAWTEPVAITTQFPSPSQLQALVEDATTVSLTWVDNADNEAGLRVERRREYAGGWGRWTEIADLAPNTESYEADAPPDTTVEYRVTAYTPHAEGSDTAGATMPAMGLAPRNVHASGWHVEITRPDADGVAEPTILDGVELNPQLNDKPEVVVPIPYDEQWLDERWERQPVRAWRDGERLPVERVIDTELARGGGSNQVQLYLRGGHDLDARYQDEVRDRSAHNVMRDVLEASGYAYTVDPAPAAEGESFGTLNTTQDFVELVEGDPFDGPVEFDFGVEPRRTAIMTPLDEITAAGIDIVSDTTLNWTASNAAEIPFGEGRDSTWTFELDYPIPADHLGVWFRMGHSYDGFLIVYLDGQKIASEARQADGESGEAEWEDMLQLGSTRTVDDIDDLGAGEHTMTIETTSTDAGTNLGGTGSAYIDMPVVFDTREWDPDNFATTLTDGDDRLDGPPGVYSTQDVDFRIRPLQRATGATLDATVSDTSNDQAIGVGPIVDDVELAPNATSIDRDFASSTQDIIARLRLGGADGGSGDSPNPGVEQYYTNYRTRPQRVEDLTVQYDALGSPSITESIDNPIQEVLTSKADRANCIWELQWDADAGEPKIVVTQVGQRTSDADPTLAQYSVTKDLSREISGATVYGRTQSVEGEQFEAQSTGVDLINDNIQGSSERVYDADGTVYQSAEDAGEETSGDYEMEYQDGRISVLQEGEMSLVESYYIDYDWHPVGSVERTGIDFENHRSDDFSGIRSDVAAQQAASFLVDELGAPQWEAEVTIPRREAGFALVDAIAPSQLPTPADERFEIKSIEESAGEVSLTLGARRSASDVLDQIERSLGETAREV